MLKAPHFWFLHTSTCLPWTLTLLTLTQQLPFVKPTAKLFHHTDFAAWLSQTNRDTLQHHQGNLFFKLRCIDFRRRLCYNSRSDTSFNFSSQSVKFFITYVCKSQIVLSLLLSFASASRTLCLSCAFCFPSFFLSSFFRFFLSAYCSILAPFFRASRAERLSSLSNSCCCTIKSWSSFSDRSKLFPIRE